MGLSGSAPNNEIVLTARGRRLAESMVRRHRLAERMVVDILGLDLDMAHIEAHRLEHAISSDLEERIRERLQDPKTCPFGHPIPGSGYVAAKDSVPLSTSGPGQAVAIDRVPEDDQALLEYFVETGLLPGKVVEVLESAAFRGVIKLLCDKSEVVLGYEVAERIWVRPTTG